jgi:hypothetical protein
MPHKSETAFTGWRAPNVREKGGGAYSDPEKARQRLASGHQVNLEDQVLALAGWSSPRASDGEKGGPNMSFGAGGTPLPAQAAQMAGWNAPTSLAKATEDYNEAGNSAGLVAIRGAILSSLAPTQKGFIGALTPEFVCWLMGYPAEWLSCVDWGTLSSRKKRRK